MYDEILEQASKFDAKFKEYDILPTEGKSLIAVANKVAIDINQPHEDDHIRTPMTELLILQLLEYGSEFTINKMTVQHLHYMLFSGELSSPGIKPGYYRHHSVKVGNHIPPNSVNLDYLMDHWFYQANKMTPTAMYKIFQTIHPFSDGNGRVGGILLAVKSYLDSDGKLMLAPCQ